MDDEEQGLSGWLDGLSERLQAGLTEAMETGGPSAQAAKDFLNGTWLGHPLHPALVFLPLGAWSTAAVLDVLGEQRAADASIGLGILSSLPTAAAGLAQWHDIQSKPRRVGMAHALLNTIALGCYTGSWAARAAGHRKLGFSLSTLGLATTGVSGYLGGELAYNLGVGVSRTAWSTEVEDASPAISEFQVAAPASSHVEGDLSAGEIEVDGQKIPLVLLKRGNQVLALNGTCTHAGGPLAEGKLVDGDCVQCPWHGSIFNMHDGTVVQSPATASQPHFEARVRDGNVEVRAVREG
ncbi:MAG: Rieske 2Fe-2S domain-containing protein [Chloroflexota bacterium]|nr:Rieske 2Fe-2S domain-containing protein [Chloroflexota bacterium]